MRSPARSLAALALAILLSLFATGQALAHAQLIGSEPSDGGMVPAEPVAVTLTFNEPVSVLVLSVIAPDGTVRPAEGKGEGDVVRVSVPKDMAQGTRVISYRVMSTDGHPVAGTLTYSVGFETASGGVSADAGRVYLLAALVAGRWASLLLLATAVGGAVFAAFVAGTVQGVRLVRQASACMVIPLAVWLVATGIDMTGAADFAGLAAALQSPTGRTIIVFLLAGLLARTAILGADARRIHALAALVLAAVGFALSGHASSAAPQALTIPAVVIHAATALFWAGSLPPLLMLARSDGDRAAHAARGFSAIAMVTVAALAAGGTALAVVQMESLDAFLTTRYGNLLAIKLCLVGVLLGIAVLNRFRFTDQLALGRPRAFQRAMRLDLIAMALVLAVVAGWRITPPPRALHTAAAKVGTHIHTSEAMADITVQPGQRGRNRMALMLMTGEFGTLEPNEVRVVLTDPASRVEPLERSAHKGADGLWHIDDMNIPLVGRYQLSVVMLIDDFTQKAIDGELEIKP